MQGVKNTTYAKLQTEMHRIVSDVSDVKKSKIVYKF